MPVAPPLEYICTPSSLLASTPCLGCLSEKQMLSAIAGIFAVESEQTASELLEASACFMCLSKKQMLQALVTVLGNQLLGEGNDAQDVLDASACIECASEKQLLAAILFQLCNRHFLTVD